MLPPPCAVDGCADGRQKRPRERQAVQLGRLAKKVAELGSGFEVVEEIFSARVPLLRLRHVETGLAVDVSSHQPTGDRADRAVGSSLHRLGGHGVVILVKSWARRRGVLGAFEGFLSSFCWTLLTLYALRRRSSFPDVGGSCATAGRASSSSGTARGGRGSLSALVALRGVFEDMLELGGSAELRRMAVDALEGTLSSRPPGERSRRRNGRAAPLFLRASPEDASDNAARSLTYSGWRACLVEARRGLRLCQAGRAAAAVALFRRKRPGALKRPNLGVRLTKRPRAAITGQLGGGSGEEEGGHTGTAKKRLSAHKRRRLAAASAAASSATSPVLQMAGLPPFELPSLDPMLLIAERAAVAVSPSAAPLLGT